MITGSLAAATFSFETDAADLAEYARRHLERLGDATVSEAKVRAVLRWHDGQPPTPPRRRLLDEGLIRVDRDIYTEAGRLHWFRVDDLRDLHLRFEWNGECLDVEGNFYHRLGSTKSSDRLRRVLSWRRRRWLRQRRFTTLLSYLVYYPCWWWLERLHGIHPLHAAGVLTEAGVVLLAGASGVGKSTMAVALAMSPGARLLSDSFVLHRGTDIYAVPEPVLLDAWSRQWLGARAAALREIDWGYVLERGGYQLPVERSAGAGPAVLLLLPRRAAKPYCKRISAEEAQARVSAADFIINDLRRYWAFAAVLEQMDPIGLAARREAQIGILAASLPCYELGLAADAPVNEVVGSISALLPETPLQAVGERP